jgi:hypothetical protein
VGSRATVLSNKRITTTIKSRVVSEQLVEVNDDGSRELIGEFWARSRIAVRGIEAANQDATNSCFDVPALMV